VKGVTESGWFEQESHSFAQPAERLGCAKQIDGKPKRLSRTGPAACAKTATGGSNAEGG